MPYTVRLIGRDDQKSASYRELQPFGQVPVFEENGIAMFESGAIVLNIAERSPALMPAGTQERERVRSWLFAALNSIEPPVTMLNVIDMQPPDIAAGTQALRERVLKWIEVRLQDLDAALKGREYLVGNRFTAADLAMTTVLRILRTTDRVDSIQAIAGYVARCEARPQFQKALADQMQAFAENAPPARGPLP